MRIEHQSSAQRGSDDGGCAGLARHCLSAPIHALACGFAAIRMQHQWGARASAKGALGQYQAHKSDHKQHSHALDGTQLAHSGSRYSENPCALETISRYLARSPLTWRECLSKNLVAIQRRRVKCRGRQRPRTIGSGNPPRKGKQMRPFGGFVFVHRACAKVVV